MKSLIKTVTSLAVAAVLVGGIGTGIISDIGIVTDNSTIVSEAASIPNAAYPTKVTVDKDNKITLTWTDSKWKSKDGSKGIQIRYNTNGWNGDVDIVSTTYSPSSSYDKKVNLPSKNNSTKYSVKLSAKAATDVKIRYYQRVNGKYKYGAAKTISVFTPKTKLPYPYGELAPLNEFELHYNTTGNKVNVVQVDDGKAINCDMYKVYSGWFMENVDGKCKSATVKDNTVTLSYNVNCVKKDCFITDYTKKKNARTYIVGTATFKIPAAKKISTSVSIDPHKYNADKITGVFGKTKFTLNKSKWSSYYGVPVYSGTIKFKANGYDGKKHSYSIPFMYCESTKAKTNIPESKTKIICLRSNNGMNFIDGRYAITTSNVKKTFEFRELIENYHFVNNSKK